MAAIFSEHTHLADEVAADAIIAASEGKTVVFTILGTTHYPMIDSPFAFVSAIKGASYPGSQVELRLARTAS